MSRLVQEEYAKERRTRRMEDFQNSSSIDISENEILKYGDSILNILLFDRTTRRNIIWGTSDYESLGNAYRSQFPITINLITGDNKDIIQPRIYKEKVSQFIRTKDTTLQLHSIESTVVVWLSFLC